jgi:hypothetical protein
VQVSSSPYPRTETVPVSQMLCFQVFRVADERGMSKDPGILYVTIHPLELIVTYIFHRKTLHTSPVVGQSRCSGLVEDSH